VLWVCWMSGKGKLNVTMDIDVQGSRSPHLETLCDRRQTLGISVGNGGKPPFTKVSRRRFESCEKQNYAPNRVAAASSRSPN